MRIDEDAIAAGGKRKNLSVRNCLTGQTHILQGEHIVAERT